MSLGWRSSRAAVIGVVGGLLLLFLGGASVIAQPAGRLVLEDFRTAGVEGLPQGWKAQRSETKARESYHLRSEQDLEFLAAARADQRVYKRVAWDPRALPIVTWRWRLKPITVHAGKNPSSPEDDVIAAVFVSLDTDLFVIPVATKYVWSFTKAKGSMTEGGLFGAAEIVLRTGPQPVGEWVEERVNAYEDFKRIHGHDPAAQAWGISLLGGPGVEVDFGPIAASSE
ncbi:MAG: DUF3047 domain-containing protein [Nitrospiraceae bacterium]